MSKKPEHTNEVVEAERKTMSEYGQITIPVKWRPDDAEGVELRRLEDGTVEVEMLRFESLNE
jgi:bifunctional DNA-binding transcriptional regulator/antitoxin component of YhaV-PrlF toxin-antitoxin module